MARPKIELVSVVSAAKQLGCTAVSVKRTLVRRNISHFKYRNVIFMEQRDLDMLLAELKREMDFVSENDTEA